MPDKQSLAGETPRYGPPLRVLAISESALYGGAEAFFVRVVEDLAASDQCVVTSAVPAENDRLSDAISALAGVDAFAIPALPQRLAAVRLYDPKRLRTLGAALGDADFDVALLNMPSPEHGASLVLAPRAAGIRAVGLLHIPHGPDEMGLTLGRVRSRLAALCTRRLKALAVLSPGAAEIARARWSGRDTCVEVVPLPRPRSERVAPAQARESLGLPAGRVIGILGRISIPQKGHDVFVQAARSMVDREEPDNRLHFAVAGSGPDGSAVRDLVERYELSERFIFLGAIDPADRFLSAVDALAIPSRYEGVPLVALEALQVGTAGVATSIAGLGDVWPFEWQVARDDSDALARGLERVLESPESEREAILVAASRAAERFVTDRPAARLLRILRQVARQESQLQPQKAGAPTERITVLVTTYNAEDDLPPLLAGLAEQRRPPDEVVIVDAGSSDGTCEMLEDWSRSAPFSVRVHTSPGANISAGRNIGVRLAASEWVAVTDAGCRPHPGWLAALVEATAGVDFVAGLYQATGTTPFEQVLAISLYPDPDELAERDILTRTSHRLYGRRYGIKDATGRSMAFTKRAWSAVGGFSEQVVAGEDVAFSTAIVEAGFDSALATGAMVDWRPRPTWVGNGKMYRGYARGDVRFGLPKRHVLRATAWLAALTATVAGGRIRRLAAAAWFVSYAALPVRRAVRHGLRPRYWWRIPLVLALKDWSMLAGAALGVRDEAISRRRQK